MKWATYSLGYGRSPEHLIANITDKTWLTRCGILIYPWWYPEESTGEGTRCCVCDTIHRRSPVKKLLVNHQTGDICSSDDPKQLSIPHPLFSLGEQVVWKTSVANSRHFATYDKPKTHSIVARLYGLDDRTWFYEIHAGEHERKWLAVEFELISVKQHLIEEQLIRANS